MIKKKILITGGSGFIGTNFINFISDRKNYKVFNIDKLSSVSTPEKFKTHKTSNYNFLKINILDEKKLNKLFLKIKPDYIINFAAESHVDRSIDNPKFFLENNILSAVNLFNSFRNLIKCKKNSIFIQISTDEVFGSNRTGLSRETSSYRTSSPYSSSKASANLIAQSFIDTYGLNIKILNLCNNYGPYQYLEKFIPTVIFSLLKNKKVPIYGNGLNIREWMHVEDTCKIIEKIISSKKNFDSLNIGSNYRINNIYIANLIFEILNKKKLTKISKEKFFKFIKDRPGHDFRYALNSKKFYSTFNFKNKFNIKTGLEHTVNWYIKNITWVKEMTKNFNDNRIGLND